MSGKSIEKRRRKARRSALESCRTLVRRLQGELVRLPNVGGHLSYLGVAVEVLEQALDAYQSYAELSQRTLSNEEGAALRRRILREAYHEALKPPEQPIREAVHELDAMVFPGTTFSVPEVLQFLSFNAKSGTVVVTTADEVITIQLDEGAVVDAMSDNSPEDCRLGQILVSQGALTQEALETFLASDDHGGKRLGEGLSQDQVVTRDELVCALRTQIQRHFQRCVAAESPDVRFLPCDSERSHFDVNINLTSLLLESTAQVDRPEVAST